MPGGYTSHENPVRVYGVSIDGTLLDCVAMMSAFQQAFVTYYSRSWLAGFLFYVSVAIVPPCIAQVSPTPANPQNPSTQSLQAGVETSSLIAPSSTGNTPSVSTVQGVASVSSSSRPGSLRSAGQGLPGMPGGPPLKGWPGYQDPSSAYMRPTTIGALVCDPLLDGACD